MRIIIIFSVLIFRFRIQQTFGNRKNGIERFKMERFKMDYLVNVQFVLESICESQF